MGSANISSLHYFLGLLEKIAKIVTIKNKTCKHVLNK